ncbi:MAG: hypothetical protein WCD45_08600 [Gallionella sp.]
MTQSIVAVEELHESVDLDFIRAAIGSEQDPLKIREFILSVDAAMSASADAELAGFVKGVDCIKVEHHFADSVYLRRGIIPKGMVLVGKIHRTEHLNIVLSGDISVLDESGMHRYKAGDIIKSPAGSKRLGYAHEETVWINLHATQERDPALIEQQVTADSYDQLGLVGVPVRQLKGG